MKKRIFFDKVGDMKYISHLDLMRFFERLLKKSKIKIKFSEGFHPRPRMSFGNPVSLGVEAYNEVVDMEILEEISGEELVRRLNENVVSGLLFKKAIEVPRKSNLIEDFPVHEYIIKGNDENIGKLRELLEKDEIIVEKVKRGKVKRRDLKERVKSIEDVEGGLKVNLENTSPNVFFKEIDLTLGEFKVEKHTKIG